MFFFSSYCSFFCTLISDLQSYIFYLENNRFFCNFFYLISYLLSLINHMQMQLYFFLSNFPSKNYSNPQLYLKLHLPQINDFLYIIHLLLHPNNSSLSRVNSDGIYIAMVHGSFIRVYECDQIATMRTS